MNTIRNGKAPASSERNGLSNQNFINAGSISKGFDAFNLSRNASETQDSCDICDPNLQTKPNGEPRLCNDCKAENKQTATAFFDNFQRHRKIIKLDCFCFACNAPKSSLMMSKHLPICRKCADDLKAKGATAQGSLISRAINNFHKKLKAVTT